MSKYRPDYWTIIKIKTDRESSGFIYKVLAGWSGSYLSGSSWKLNSGITEIKKIEGKYHIKGHSGSVYICHPDSEGVRGYANTILADLIARGCEEIPINEILSLFKGK